MPETGHAAGEYHTYDEQVGPQQHGAADPIPIPEPAHQRADERCDQPLQGKGDGDREVAPAEPLGALQIGNQHADGEPHGGGDHTDHRGDRNDDPGVMEPLRATGEPGRTLVGHTPREPPQSQHVCPPYRWPSNALFADSREKSSMRISYALCWGNWCARYPYRTRHRTASPLTTPVVHTG